MTSPRDNMLKDERIIENLGFMVQDVGRLMRRDYNRRVQVTGVTQAQWRAIMVLWRNPGISQARLSDILEMQPISVARLVDRMQASGHVERKPDPTDRRAVRLFLTDKAEPVRLRLMAYGVETRAAALSGLSLPEQEQLMNLLARMRGNLTGSEEGQG
ncbi:MAG: MarR family transcriptional regulator [Micavibrio sp.]|nr:MarR family transcriptional regulator [Micavibrio sp.]